MDKKIINIGKLKRTFHVGIESIHALKGVDISIDTGEFLTIMGASGSGKSTLLNILGCLDTQSSGEYHLDNVLVRKLTKNQRAILRNQKIGFVFQTFNLLPRTSALENVELPLFYNKKYSGAQRREKALWALESVSLGDRLNHTPNQLSGGQQQRVAIARSLVNDPVVILADEATGNLDTRTSYEIMALFQKLNDEQGKTIVFITHEPDIATFSKRTIKLRDGKKTEDYCIEQRVSAIEMLKNLPEGDD